MSFVIALIVSFLTTAAMYHFQMRAIRAATPAPAIATKPPVIAFDWLRDYGPHWEPDCKAFWLDPDTDEQRAAWERKYRPKPIKLIDVQAQQQMYQAHLMQAQLAMQSCQQNTAFPTGLTSYGRMDSGSVFGIYAEARQTANYGVKVNNPQSIARILGIG